MVIWEMRLNPPAPAEFWSFLLRTTNKEPQDFKYAGKE